MCIYRSGSESGSGSPGLAHLISTQLMRSRPRTCLPPPPPPGPRPLSKSKVPALTPAWTWKIHSCKLFFFLLSSSPLPRFWSSRIVSRERVQAKKEPNEPPPSIYYDWSIFPPIEITKPCLIFFILKKNQKKTRFGTRPPFPCIRVRSPALERHRTTREGRPGWSPDLIFFTGQSCRC